MQPKKTVCTKLERNPRWWNSTVSFTIERDRQSVDCKFLLHADYVDKRKNVAMYTTSRVFEVALRGCSEDAKDDYSRIRTATRSNCCFLCLFIRQVGRLVKQGNSPERSCRPNAPHIQVLVLHS